mmetsp:Transcript_31552/g.68961  ORF Transcript_31552/g.68961 Transcript_31552/m.68961 type:complete len:194 (-) Transcript_31552:130-711(-)
MSVVLSRSTLAKLPHRPMLVALYAGGKRMTVYMGSDGDFAPSYNGKSPERFVSEFLHAFFTQAGARIVLKQLEGLAPRSSLAITEEEQANISLDGEHTTSRAADHYEILKNYLEEVPCRDGDKWLEGIMKKDQLLGLRVAEARVAYAGDGFQWDVLKGMVPKQLEDGNAEVMRERVTSQINNMFGDESQSEER